MLEVVDKLQDTSGVAELQQLGDELVSLVKETHRMKEKDIQGKLEMLRHEGLKANKKVCYK